MSGCGAYLRRLTTGLAGCALRRGEPIVAAVPSWSASPSPLCVAPQPRWRACYATAAPTLNPLDQVAIPEPETTPQGSQQYKKKKKDPRFKFQEKGVFGENLYTKGFSENLHISPHKLNDMVKVLRGQSIHDAIIQCQMSVKKAAKLCEEAIVECRKKAIDQNGVDPQKLLIDEMWVGKGQYLKRNSMHARGRSGVLHKYRSHLTIMMREDAEMEVRTRVIPMAAERAARRHARRTTPAGGKTLVEIGA
ncbi:MRPL22 [Auxenochlorella protothecoides x Auxenochlorella symbiontica]